MNSNTPNLVLSYFNKHVTSQWTSENMLWSHLRYQESFPISVVPWQPGQECRPSCKGAFPLQPAPSPAPLPSADGAAPGRRSAEKPGVLKRNPEQMAARAVLPQKGTFKSKQQQMFWCVMRWNLDLTQSFFSFFLFFFLLSQQWQMAEDKCCWKERRRKKPSIN